MTTKTWQDIWDSKRLDSNFDFNKANNDEIIKELLRCNGFDSKSGVFDIQAYQGFIQEIFYKADLQECESVYEVGCGAGAFLYSLNNLKTTNNTLGANLWGGGGEC